MIPGNIDTKKVKNRSSQTNIYEEIQYIKFELFYKSNLGKQLLNYWYRVCCYMGVKPGPSEKTIETA